MVTSATMKRLWADPEWRERQIERKIEGQTRAAHEGRVGGQRVQNGTRLHGKMKLSAYIDAEVWESLKAVATRQNKPLSELIRTYVEWGLEQELQCRD